MLGQGGRGGPSPGLYGFLAIVSIAGPFIHHFWKDRRAVLGGLLPLLFMVLVGIMVGNSINNAMGGAASGPYAEMQKQAQEEMMKAISIGMGVYLSLLVSLYFAGIALKNYLVSRASEQPVLPQKAAA
jgi:uncharacterized membrane protein YjgN (DUF898 family)